MSRIITGQFFNIIIPRQLYQGCYNAKDYMPHEVDLHIHCAYEVDPEFVGQKNIWIKMDDTHIDWGEPRYRGDIGKILKTAQEAAHVLNEGGSVLTTCNMGLNRSGLISGSALVLSGNYTPKQAIRLIRQRRGGALHNPSFTKFIRSLYPLDHA